MVISLFFPLCYNLKKFWEVLTVLFQVSKIEKIDKKEANKPLTLRLPEDIYIRYKTLSKHSNQSMNSILVSALRYALNHLEE